MELFTRRRKLMSGPSEAAFPKDVGSFTPASLPRCIARLSKVGLSWGEVIEKHGLDPQKRHSAVLFLFVPGLDQNSPAAILFTVRSHSVRSHRGQISFAGGRRDFVDLTPAETALRELHEEVGAPTDLVKVLGVLPPINGFDRAAILPVVALAPLQLECLSPSSAEVQAVFSVPWPKLTRTNAQYFRFNIFGNWLESLSFSTPNGNIWGLTALILYGAALA